LYHKKGEYNGFFRQNRYKARYFSISKDFLAEKAGAECAPAL
jgi:hypothetical protein